MSSSLSAGTTPTSGAEHDGTDAPGSVPQDPAVAPDEPSTPDLQPPDPSAVPTAPERDALWRRGQVSS